MSRHSYTKVWLHIIWGTLRREKVLISNKIRKEIKSLVGFGYFMGYNVNLLFCGMGRCKVLFSLFYYSVPDTLLD